MLYQILMAIRDTIASILAAIRRWIRRMWFWIQRFVGGRGADAALVASIVGAFAVYVRPGEAWLRENLGVIRITATMRLLSAAVVVWGIVFLIALVLARGGGPAIKEWFDRLARRTGIAATERIGLVLSSVLLIYALGGHGRLLPLAGFGLISFFLLVTRPIELRPVGTRTSVSAPPGAPERLMVETADEDDVAVKTFQWELPAAGANFRGRVEVPINLPRLELMREQNPYGGDMRPRDPDFVLFTIKGFSDEVLKAAVELRRIAEDWEFSTFLQISNVLAFSQSEASIRYVSDEASTGREEYFRFPIETLHDQEGDCEDKSILAAGILLALGHETAILLMPGHVAIGVVVPPGIPGDFYWDGSRSWYFCETTAEGWRVGDKPAEIADRDITLIPLSQVPA